jgi:hypothetical protein
MEVGREALKALVATQAVLDLKERRLDPHVQKRDAVEPVTPETPTMLPHVHTLWNPLLRALAVWPELFLSSPAELTFCLH